MSDYTIEDRVVQPEDCNKFGMLLQGKRVPAGTKYKVKVKKPVKKGPENE